MSLLNISRIESADLFVFVIITARC